jgi:hypothetical protein
VVYSFYDLDPLAFGAGTESRDRGINRSAAFGARIYAAKALDAVTRITLLQWKGKLSFPAPGEGGSGQSPELGVKGTGPLAGS